MLPRLKIFTCLASKDIHNLASNQCWTTFLPELFNKPNLNQTITSFLTQTHTCMPLCLFSGFSFYLESLSHKCLHVQILSYLQAKSNDIPFTRACFSQWEATPPLDCLLFIYVHVVIAIIVPTTGNSIAKGLEDVLWSQTARVQTSWLVVGLWTSYLTSLYTRVVDAAMPHPVPLGWLTHYPATGSAGCWEFTVVQGLPFPETVRNYTSHLSPRAVPHSQCLTDQSIKVALFSMATLWCHSWL